MKTKTVGIRYIENRNIQFLDGTDHYPEFYIKVKFTDMVYLQNGKCCRLEVIGSADNIYDTGFEASIHFGGKAYDLTSDKHIDILAKRLGCQPFSIWRLQEYIHEKLVEMCHELSYFHHHRNDELDTFSISIDSKEALRFRPAFTESESASDYALKIGDRIIPVKKHVLDQGDYGFVESITFDLGDDTKVNVVYGNSEYVYTTGYENYIAVVKLEKSLGLKPGDGMKILRRIGRV
jgi:hypothetical protein